MTRITASKCGVCNVSDDSPEIKHIFRDFHDFLQFDLLLMISHTHTPARDVSIMYYPISEIVCF